MFKIMYIRKKNFLHAERLAGYVLRWMSFIPMEDIICWEQIRKLRKVKC